MIITKNKREIEIMARAGEIVALVHQAMKLAIKPGVTTAQLDKLAEKIILENHATPSFKNYNGFPASICASVNEQLVHGFPSDYVLKDGDIITVDVGACYEGYHGDSAWTYAVGTISKEAQLLLDVTHDSLFEGLKQVKPGNRLTDVSHAIQSYAEQFGYHLPEDYTGHGIGRDLHEDPVIPNYGKPGRGPILKTGMVLAIEPMVQIGTKETVTLSDGWTVISKDHSLSAHFEHTVVVTEDGYDILTTLKQ